MTCGVKFCGGCNPRYDRGKAFHTIKEHFGERVEFLVAEENVNYDFLLVIGGCTNCCASFEQYQWKSAYIKMWEEGHFYDVVEKIEDLISNH
ncbi:MAG: hypothetical protein RR131_08535 [Anaerovorax sp.]